MDIDLFNLLQPKSWYDEHSTWDKSVADPGPLFSSHVDAENHHHWRPAKLCGDHVISCPQIKFPQNAQS